MGTGSSGIQLTPKVAKQAAHLFVFQRTANYSLPARNAPLNTEYKRATKNRHAQVRNADRESPNGVAGFTVPEKSIFEVSPQEREQTFQQRWEAGGIGFTRAVNGVLINKDANALAADFVRREIGEIVHSPAVAQLPIR